MFQFPGLPSRRCGIFQNEQKTPHSISLNSYRAFGGLEPAPPPLPTTRVPHAHAAEAHVGSRYGDDGDGRAHSDRTAVVQKDRRAETSFRPVDLETQAQPAMRDQRSSDDARDACHGDSEDSVERATHNSPTDDISTYTVRPHCAEGALSDDFTRSPGPYDEEASDGTAGEDDDTALDDEVATILVDGQELQTHRNTERREYKRRRSLSRMSTSSGVMRRRNLRRRRSRTGAIRRGENAGFAVRATSGATESCVAPTDTVEPRGYGVRAVGVLSTVMKYAKYPMYITTNLLSAYVVLSYTGVDLTRYADLTRVSSSLLSRMDGGTALTEFLRRFVPTLLTNSDRPSSS